MRIVTLEFLIDFKDGYLGIKTEENFEKYIEEIINKTYNKYLNSVNTKNHTFEYVVSYILENLSKKYGFYYNIFVWHEYEPDSMDIFNAYGL